MKKTKFEMIVTPSLTKTIRKDFHEIVELLMVEGIPSTVREEKKFWNSKFTITCLHFTPSQLSYVNRVGNALEHYSKEKNERNK